MNILIAGGSGFIGQKLFSYFTDNGYQVKTLVRRKAYRNFEISWDPDRLEVPDEAIQEADVIINLCGRNISDSLWSPKFKQELYESRIKPTRTLARAISKASNKKLTLISTSGIAIYGAQLSSIATEESATSTGFFSELANNWEQEAQLAESNIHRVVIVRLGVVLGFGGGIVRKISPSFKLGLGAKIGCGTNWISWVGINDVCRAVEYIIRTENLNGPVNLVNPNSYLADDFYNELGKAFGRSVIFRIPSFVIRSLLGEFAEETVLASQQVAPQKLLDSGFEFSINSPREASTKSW